jgi:hypothetical protein
MTECPRGVYRHDLFDGTAEYHLVDSKGPVTIVQTAARVPRELADRHLSEFLNLLDPDGGITSPVESEYPPLHVLRSESSLRRAG